MLQTTLNKMRTLWNSGPEILNFHINKVGDVFKQYQFTKIDNDTLATIRRHTYNGLMDSKKLLILYLEQNGYVVDANGNIIKQKQTD